MPARVLAVLALVLATSAGGAAARPPYENPRLPVRERVADLLGRMTLAEKAGQMTQGERLYMDSRPSPVTTLGLGSVLSGGGSVPEPNRPKAWADMVDRLQRAALATRLGIPLLYGIDSVHGHGNLLGATVFPHNIGLGATRDPRLVRAVHRVTAEETRATGPQWVFGPCVCAARDDRWGRTYESFGEDAGLVVEMETAIDGLRAGRVLSTAKHFAGDGFTAYGSGAQYPIDQGVTVTSRRAFRRHALRQYAAAVRHHDVDTVMPSFSSVDWTEDGVGNPVKMHASRELITGFLKRELGFGGIVISDWAGIHQLPGDFAAQVRAGVRAGIDVFMEPDRFADFRSTLIAEVRAGRIAVSRIDDAVRRILRKKFELGLFEHPLTDRRRLREVGSPAHRALARRAVARSQVLLRNRHRVLPLRRGARVYVAGSKADSIGDQAGGWTLSWQGSSANVIPGTTILAGIRRALRGRMAPVPRGAIGVVVVGETPYAEYFGDVGGPGGQTMELSAADGAAVDRVCAAARRCVVVVVSGRPLVIEPARLRAIDGLVAAWLPGSEGAGVADALFGRRPYTGRLPVSWPRSLAQEPVNLGDRGYDPLYRLGFGLRTH